MTEAEFGNLLSARQAECEQIVRFYLPKEEGYPATVLRAMNYSVEAGGKRLRPMFLLETARMYGAREALYHPFMAALEMIHTYSLVHDDLPAMDNDRYRRGRLTTWAVYGEGMAVIAGDGLLNYAFETALKAFDGVRTKEENERVIAALRRLAANAGPTGMVGGQCADIEADASARAETVAAGTEGTGGAAANGIKKDPVAGTAAPGEIKKDPAAGKTAPDADRLRYIQEKKTACLIDSGLTIGAILGGAPEDDQQKLAAIAVDVGLAFQIEDDILDVTSTPEVLGKSIGKDAAEGKVTYVTMYGLDQAEEEAKKLTEEALALFDALSAQNAFLRRLLEKLATRSR